MPYHMASGTAANTADFAVKLRDFLVTTCGWRLHDSGVFSSTTIPYWILESFGESGAEDIYVMLIDDTWSPRLSLRIFQYWNATTHIAINDVWNFDVTYVSTANASFLYWFYADLDHFFVVTKIGTTYYGQYAGIVRRFASSAVAITQAAAQAGSNVVIPVSDATIFSIPDYYVIRDSAKIERVRVTARDLAASPQTITIETLANPYAAGAKIGEDPQPVIVGKNTSPGAFLAANLATGYASKTGHTGACYVADGGARAYADPEARYGRTVMFPWLAVLTGAAFQEVRGELIEVYAIGSDNVDSEDQLQVGAATYKVFNLSGPGFCAVKEA